MEDSCEPIKRKMSAGSTDTKVVTSSIATEENTGNVQHLHLPHLVSSNAKVVGKILENLDFEDLLQCSLVNKVWNYEGRRILREKHQCVLAFNLDSKSPEEIIMKFVETTLAAGLPVPYVNLSIKKKSVDEVLMKPLERKESELAEMVKDFVLRAGPFKVVQLDFWCLCESSFEVYFTRKVMTEILKTVEVLAIKNLCSRSQILAIPEQAPELKKLEVDGRAEIDEPDRRSLMNIIMHSPKLETVGCLSSELLYLVDSLPPARKLELVKEFTCDDMDMYIEEAEKFAALKPKLEKLIIPRGPNHRQYIRDRSISLPLLLSSEASLIELHAPLEVLEELLRQNPLASFANLRYLTVDTPLQMGSAGLGRNDPIITHVFPKLENMATIREARSPGDELFAELFDTDDDDDDEYLYLDAMYDW